MNAEPTIPNTWVTPLTASVSTRASDGPIFCDDWLTAYPLPEKVSFIETICLVYELY